jgi:hypothetical protein
MMPSLALSYLLCLGGVHGMRLGLATPYGRFLERLGAGEDFCSPLARGVGSKGYHQQTFAEGPYPVE